MEELLVSYEAAIRQLGSALAAALGETAGLQDLQHLEASVEQLQEARQACTSLRS